MPLSNFKKKTNRFSKKKIFFFLILLISLIILVIGWNDVKGGRGVQTFKSILPFSVKIPPKIRSFLKKTIFFIPDLQSTNKKQRLRIEELKNLRKHAI